MCYWIMKFSSSSIRPGRDLIWHIAHGLFVFFWKTEFEVGFNYELTISPYSFNFHIISLFHKSFEWGDFPQGINFSRFGKYFIN